jgi:hypothetical protein
MNELIFNKTQKEGQKDHKYDIFPFNPIGTALQNILYTLVQRDDPFINELLSKANFGFIFGEQLIMDYEFLKHCIENRTEGLVLVDVSFQSKIHRHL